MLALVRKTAVAFVAGLTLPATTGGAFAHGTERGLVMLLPTGHYMVGSALAVAMSFAVLTCLPDGWFQRISGARLRLFSIPQLTPFWPSMVSFAVMAVLLAAGFAGTGDPLANPLPLFVWTVWWVGLTSLQFFTGNLWTHLNPWSGPCTLVQRVLGRREPLLRLPEGLGYLPAIIVFALFAWFELIYSAPEDPGRLARVVLAYWVLGFAGVLVFGERDWFERAEPFAIFFRLVGACSPLQRHQKEDGRTCLKLRFPGSGVIDLPVLPISGILFVLLTLSTVSFDGFARTFLWLGTVGVNPLEFPGRSALVELNTLGLFTMFAMLATVFLGCVAAGCALIRRGDTILQAAGRLIYSIVPISLVFHMAHYLTAFMVNGQYAALVLNDPFGTGANLLGLDGVHVTTSFLTNIHSVSALWTLQTALIVCGHVVGIVAAHLIARRLFDGARQIALSQVFLAALMVFYTAFGLWLLSTPSIG